MVPMGGVWSAPRQKVAGRGLKILDERHKHSWVYIRKKQTLIQKGTGNLVYIASLCTTAKTWKQPVH